MAFGVTGMAPTDREFNNARGESATIHLYFYMQNAVLFVSLRGTIQKRLQIVISVSLNGQLG